MDPAEEVTDFNKSVAEVLRSMLAMSVLLL